MSNHRVPLKIKQLTSALIKLDKMGLNVVSIDLTEENSAITILPNKRISKLNYCSVGSGIEQGFFYTNYFAVLCKCSVHWKVYSRKQVVVKA